MQKVFLTEPIHPNAIALLREHFEVVQGVETDEAAVIRQAQGCDAALVRVAKITDAVMAGVPTLKVIAKHGMGVDNIDVEAATARGVLVVNAPFSNLNAVAEHIVMLLLALSKRVVRMDRLTRSGSFAQRSAFHTTELRGVTVGFIGMGKIAKLAAKKLTGFDLRVIAYDPFVRQADVDALQVVMTPAEQVYRTADFVIVHTALTAETYHLVGAAQLQAMKPSAYLINASRGPIVDEQALVEALRAGEIAGAGLDVFEQEPPPAEHPLFSMDNVIVSPHNAALSDGALLAMAMDSSQGVIEYLEGKPVSYPVNPAVLESLS
ncbi:MAG: hydroxyacid dehydrogenase [Oscillospiraceae bacterium]|nr:hydroxyacid dehydrogenase [Oscillospiraceae bacterium]